MLINKEKNRYVNDVEKVNVDKNLKNFITF